MPSIPAVPSNAPYMDAIHALDHAGCVVVTGVVDESARRRISGELQPYIDIADVAKSLNEKYAQDGGPSDFYPGHTKRITALVAKSETFRGFVTHPLMLSACDAFLKPNCVSYQVHATAGLVVGPGATE